MLLRLVKEELNRIRHRWVKSDSDGDNELNTDEFLGFRHPELFDRSYQIAVQYTLEELG